MYQFIYNDLIGSYGQEERLHNPMLVSCLTYNSLYKKQFISLWDISTRQGKFNTDLIRIRTVSILIAMPMCVLLVMFYLHIKRDLQQDKLRGGRSCETWPKHLHFKLIEREHTSFITSCIFAVKCVLFRYYLVY